MPELLKAQIGNEDEVSMYPLHEYWLDIGKMQDFERAQLEYHQIFDEEDWELSRRMFADKKVFSRNPGRGGSKGYLEKILKC